MNNKSVKFCIILIILVSFWSCAGPSSQKMIPLLEYDQVSTIDKKLKVVKIKGGQKSQIGGMVKLDNETFATAIVDCLKASKLYKDASNDGQEDYDLNATILFQETIVGASILEFITILIVEYQLIDTKSKKQIWQKTIVSRSKSTAYGITRIMEKGVEGATRKNLAKLIIELAKFEKQDKNIFLSGTEATKQIADYESGLRLVILPFCVNP